MRRIGSFAALALAPLALGLLVGCSDEAEGRIRADVLVLTAEDRASTEVRHAVDDLARYRRRALPTLEAALHTASEPGRKNLILALRRLGDGEAVPLLRHLAIFDPSGEVRREAEWTLKAWAADGQPSAAERARAAQRALRAVDEQHEREEAG
jgi:hypothetical protein